MQDTFTSHHFVDDNEYPAGGTTYGTGFAISWQHGPLGRDADRQTPNGAFVETIIQAAIDRIEFYQQSSFVSDYNARALEALFQAVGHLQARTADREARAVEGTHGR